MKFLLNICHHNSSNKISQAYSLCSPLCCKPRKSCSINYSSVLNRSCVVSIVATNRVVQCALSKLSLWLSFVLSRVCLLFVCLCCLVGTSRRSVVRQQWRPRAEDRQSKQKLEIRRKKPKNFEQIYTRNKGKCRHPLIILYLWTLNTFTFHCMCTIWL